MTLVVERIAQPTTRLVGNSITAFIFIKFAL
jgi:hypothetical protein